MKILMKNLVFTLIVPGSVGVYLPLLLARGRPPVTGPASALSILLLGIGAALYAWWAWNFATRGQGTPLPRDAPRRLVVQGPYRYTRNPMYVAVTAVVLGWALRFQSVVLLVYALGVMAVFRFFVLAYEEPHLRLSFGAEYDEYKARVPRWLPRFWRNPDG